MKEEKIKLLIEGAYAQTPTLPGFWLRYDEFRACFNDLVKNQGDEIVDIDTELFRLYPDTAIEENYQIKGTEEVFQAIRLAPNKLVETKVLRKSIESVYKAAVKDDEGWTNFASFGLNGLKEKCLEMGFVGVRQAVQCIFGNRFEFRAGNTENHEAPVLVRDLKSSGHAQDVDDQRNNEKNYKPGIVPPECETSPKQGSYIGEAINDFAFFPRPKNVETGYGWDIAINKLEEIALDENWYYNDNELEQKTKPILKKYLSYTFERLMYEDSIEEELAKKEGRSPKKKIIENSQYAMWNTGLVDSIFDPIYAYFTRNNGKNPKIKQPWVFLAFGTANSRYQYISSEFNLPQRAEYFTNPADLIYDCKGKEPTLNWEHFFKDNIDRLPIGYIKKGAPDGYPFQDTDAMPSPKRKAYYQQLADAIYQDEDWLQYLTTRFKNALHTALSRVAWNYKTAIPVMYFDRQNNTQKISLLLPLTLEKKGVIDVALVCQHKYYPERNVNNYEGKTIFTLEMAYNNARLIARPDSDWLMTLSDRNKK